MSDRELRALTGEAIPKSKSKSKSKTKSKTKSPSKKKTSKKSTGGRPRRSRSKKNVEEPEQVAVEQEKDIELDVPASEAPAAEDIGDLLPEPVVQQELAPEIEEAVEEEIIDMSSAEVQSEVSAAEELAEEQSAEAFVSDQESPALTADQAIAQLDINAPLTSEQIFEVVEQVAAGAAQELPEELPALEDIASAASTTKRKGRRTRASGASSSQPRSRSSSRSPSRRSRSPGRVPSIIETTPPPETSLHPDVGESLIGSNQFMSDLSRHIRTKSINSAKECLNEINVFRELQIEKLLDANAAEDKLENIRQLRSRLKAGDVTSKQPAGSFRQIVNDIVGGYRLAFLDNDELARKLADGYLQWVALQLELTIPRGRRAEAAALINKQLNKLLFPHSGNWMTFDEDRLILDRPGIIEAARSTADQERAESEKVEKKKSERQRRRQDRETEDAKEQEESIEREVEKRVQKRTGGRSSRSRSRSRKSDGDNSVKTVKRKKLTQQFLQTMALTVQMAGVVNALIDDLDLDRMPTTGSVEDWRQYANGLREHIPRFEAAYDQLKSKSDPFFTEYKADDRYALPVPERSLVNVSEDRMTALMRKKHVDGGAYKTASLFLYNWLEDMWRAWGATLQEPPELNAGPNLSDNLAIDRDQASIETGNFTVTAQGSTVSLETAGLLNATQQTQAMFAVSFALAWLANNEGKLISIRTPQLPSVDGSQVVGNLSEVRDWIRDNLCLTTGDNKACKTLFKALKEVTGEPRSNLDKLLRKKLDALGLRIIEGGKEERNAINFEEICAQCKADDKSCAEGSFAVDQFPKGITDEQAKHNAEEYARALQPNHWILKRATSGKGGTPSYQTVDLRQNAVLLVAVQVGYKLESDARLKATVGKARLNLEIPAGEWETAEAFVGAFNAATDGELRLSVKMNGEFPDFTLQAKNSQTFRIQEDESSTEILQMLGMRFKEADRAVKSKNSVNSLVATARSHGFLLAVRSDTSFPEGSSPHLQRLDNDTQISEQVLSSSIELDAICTGNQFDAELKTLLLLWLLSRPELVRRLTDQPKDSLLLLDLPKRPSEHDFQSSKGGASGPVVVAVNSSPEWKFWTDVWKFQTGFPEKLVKKPSGYKSTEVYALDKELAAFSRLKRRWKFATGVAEEGSVSAELEKKGPYSSRNASIWTGLMLRSIPDQAQLLAVAKTDLGQ